MINKNFSLNKEFSPIIFGDIHGCYSQFNQLIKKFSIKPNSNIWFTGDIVSRGPKSLVMLRKIFELENNATMVLGNHDLNLLLASSGINNINYYNLVNEFFTSSDGKDLLHWLRFRPFVYFKDNILLVHAGVLPNWNIHLILELAHELQNALQSWNWKTIFLQIYNNKIFKWSPNLNRIDRMSIVCHALTRIRFCTINGIMNYSLKGGINTSTCQYIPWFDVPWRKTVNITIVFGHWSSAGLILRNNLICLDSGCIWGGKLTAIKFFKSIFKRYIMQINCPSRIKFNKKI